MARNDNRKWIVCQSVANGTSFPRISEIPSNAFVGCDLPARNSMLSTQDFLLKAGASPHVNMLQRKFDLLAMKKSDDSVRNIIDL